MVSIRRHQPCQYILHIVQGPTNKVVPMKKIEITQVASPKDLGLFIGFQFKLYRDDPNWVAPLWFERRAFFNPKKNPFYDHADVALWLARRDGEVVGTISSHIDHLHNETHAEKIGMFGFFESIDDQEVPEALLSHAKAWVASRGMRALRGPLNFSMNHECGLLLDGTLGPPMVMMTYNPPYYARMFEKFGLKKAMDLYAYKGFLNQFNRNPSGLPPHLSRIAERARKRTGVTIRTLNIKNFVREIELTKKVYRDAWVKNWGFVAMTDAEFTHLARGLRHLVDPNLALLAEMGGEPIGVCIALPDACQWVKHLHGRLLPFGWAKALWYRRRVTDIRLIVAGVIEKYRVRGIESLLIFETLKRAIEAGYQGIETSWILESNEMMNKIILNIGEPWGLHRYRTYRLYQTDF